MVFPLPTQTGEANSPVYGYSLFCIRKALEACQPALSMVAQYAALFEGN
jgi:hypothetical protein